MNEIPKYVKCIGSLGYCIVGEIYECKQEFNNFQWKYTIKTSSNKRESGWDNWGKSWQSKAYENIFIPATEQEYNIANNIVPKEVVFCIY